MKTRMRGQALTEFALILPILLLLLLGIVEGARIIWAYITVQNAAREAARYGVTGQPYDDLGNPWTMRPDRFPGCDPRLDANGELIYTPDLVGGGDCAEPNDRVDAIIGEALLAGRGLGVDQYAIQPAVYTAATYVDRGGTYGVRVFGQQVNDSGVLTQVVDYAGTEGLNVLVQVYYNVRMLDPLYAAIIPEGYVRLRGEVQMQNEGIEAQLGNVPPGSIATPAAPEGATPPPPGTGNLPLVLSLDGSQIDAGEDLHVKLEYHPADADQRYDVYLYSPSFGYVRICSNLPVDSFGSVSRATCPIPPSTTPGTYQLVSLLAGAAADPANHVGSGDSVEVRYPGQPKLTIKDSSRWPPGSSITFQLFGHEPCPAGKSPCPPYQEYDLALIGGPFPAPGQPIPPPVQVNDLGSAEKTWTIPSWLAPGSYTVVTYRRNTVSPTIASTVLEIVEAKIVIQGGNRWPAGATINVHLRGHAPNRSYMLRWIDAGPDPDIEFGPVTTDQFGNTQAPQRFTIPLTTINSPDHRIISFEEGGSGDEVASTDVEVSTPEDEFITVVGGAEWPAGSLIQIEMHKHLGGPYDLYFSPITQTVSAVLIESDISPNHLGFYQTTFVIPVGTPSGSYEVRSVPLGGSDTAGGSDTVASTPIQVKSVPLIQVREGSIVMPGADITVQLTGHAPNDSFEIYLAGVLLFSLPTDPFGIGEGVYDLSNLPQLEGGQFLLESRRNGVLVASTQIYIIAPDLQVTDIQYPPGPPINTSIPMTVTVFNNSPVAVSGNYFDVDLYVDPLHAPTTSSQFPPGDYKRWIPSIPPTGTVQVVFNLTLRGAQHTLYGRVDTSNYIVESNEANNIYQELVSSTACAAEVTNALASATNWTPVDYGNADIPPGAFSVAGGVMNVTSDGSSNWASSDNEYLVYYSPQTLSGDFEARVRIVAGPTARRYATAGLEIRSDVGSASSPKVNLGVIRTNSSGSLVVKVQAGYRDGGSMGSPTGDVTVSYPVWLRIVRSGNRFIYYYSDSDSATPPASGAWTQHGEVTMANMGSAVRVGFFNVSASSTGADTARFDNFHLCLKDVDAPPPGEDFPPGLMVCSGNLLQNSGFENVQLAPWTAPNGAVNKNPDEYEGQFAALMYTYITGAHQQPVLAQSFTMPDWVVSTTTTIDLSLYKCVRDFAGSGAEANDRLNAGLRTSITPTLITSPTLVADGATTNSGPCLPGDYTAYSADLATAMRSAGRNPENYEAQTLQLYLYDTSSNLGVCNAAGGGPANPACYETDFRLDKVELEVCTTQPIPPHVPGMATIGGPLRIFVGGAPQPRQGVRVWTYKQNGDLLTTYSLHDSTYRFYNVEPGEYVIYSEYWDGPNLYSAFTTVTVGADQTITNLSLLLR